jgi:hypothetical protein
MRHRRQKFRPTARAPGHGRTDQQRRSSRTRAGVPASLLLAGHRAGRGAWGRPPPLAKAAPSRQKGAAWRGERRSARHAAVAARVPSSRGQALLVRRAATERPPNTGEGAGPPPAARSLPLTELTRLQSFWIASQYNSGCPNLSDGNLFKNRIPPNRNIEKERAIRSPKRLRVLGAGEPGSSPSRLLSRLHSCLRAHLRARTPR